MEIKIYHDDENAPYSEITALLSDSFKERVDAGQNFVCAFYTNDEYKKETKDGYIFVAMEDNEILGTACMNVHRKKFMRCGSHKFLAVSPKVKNKGVGTLLQERMVSFAGDLELVYLTSTTALPATSSVKWHIKNGFVPLYVTYFEGKTYYSYMFFKPLRYKFIFKIGLFLFSSLIKTLTYYYTKQQHKLAQI